MEKKKNARTIPITHLRRTKIVFDNENDTSKEKGNGRGKHEQRGGKVAAGWRAA